MYEVRSYKTCEDFDSFRPTNIVDGFNRKREALEFGVMEMGENAVVKVQSEDREFIEIMERSRIKFEDVQQGDVIDVTVHGDRKQWKVMGWYEVNDIKCLGLRNENFTLMLQEKFAENIELVFRKDDV